MRVQKYFKAFQHEKIQTYILTKSRAKASIQYNIQYNCYKRQQMYIVFTKYEKKNSQYEKTYYSLEQIFQQF